MARRSFLVIPFAIPAAFAAALAQSPGPGGPAAAPVSDYALTNVRIVTAPGKVIERGTIVTHDGRISAVGAQVNIPAGVVRMDLAGHTVYPGLIDAATSIGLPSPTRALPAAAPVATADAGGGRGGRGGRGAAPGVPAGARGGGPPPPPVVAPRARRERGSGRHVCAHRGRAQGASRRRRDDGRPCLQRRTLSRPSGRGAHRHAQRSAIGIANGRRTGSLVRDEARRRVSGDRNRRGGVHSPIIPRRAIRSAARQGVQGWNARRASDERSVQPSVDAGGRQRDTVVVRRVNRATDDARIRDLERDGDQESGGGRRAGRVALDPGLKQSAATAVVSLAWPPADSVTGREFGLIGETRAGRGRATHRSRFRSRQTRCRSRRAAFRSCSRRSAARAARRSATASDRRSKPA